MRRPLTFLLTGLFAFSLLTAASLVITPPASAATIAPTTTCNNALGNGGAVCEVTVVNTITPSGGSAVVTVRECTGSAGVPDATCTNATTSLSEPVTAITQCNGSINGGGGTLLCTITVTNNFEGLSPTLTGVTVNQCVGSVTTGTSMVCDPDPASTTGATITQCNGSGNGGGASLTCTASGMEASGFVVLINQCNGSSNGGGTLTVCSASLNGNIIPAAPTATPAVVGSTPPVPVLLLAELPSVAPSIPDAGMAAGFASSGEIGPFVVGTLALLLALSLMAALGHRREGRPTMR